MAPSARIATREIGTALAVLAIYVLTLLLPLHQAAAGQRDLDGLGYSTLSSWSVCVGLAEDDGGDPREAAALSCPAVGVGKHQVALPLLPPSAPSPQGQRETVRFEAALAGFATLLPDHVGQSRAPPAQA
jgi:hypothetical protein